MIEPGSFRDPTSRVFYDSGRVLRGLSQEAASVDADVRSNGLMAELVERGLVVANWIVDDVTVPDGVPAVAVVESERVPLVTYPAEWSFAMLQAAAITTLDANLVCLERGFILKDASAFNILFRGSTPVIIDVASVERFGDRGIWTAYGQFCDHFLAPLMLEAYAGVAVHRTLQSRTDGLPIGVLGRLLRGRAGLRKGVLSHVRIRNFFENRAAGMDTSDRREVGSATLARPAIVASIQKMRSLVAGLESDAPTTWADYESALPYEGSSVEEKARFVGVAAGKAATKTLAVDVGANAGRFTKILAEHFDLVVGIDSDQGAVDGLYRSVRGSAIANVTPLVVDITNSTPAFGWRGRERHALSERLRPDFATWLAVVHHLCLGVGIPLDEVVAHILDFSVEAVVEFVSPEDPMAQRISATRTADLAPYGIEEFEGYVARRGVIADKSAVSDTRTLYHIKSR
jgi:hypothetical protein